MPDNSEYHRPTAYLRFVERVVPAPEYGKDVGKTVRILQQLWTSDIVGKDEEWRDVPLEPHDETK